MEMTNILWSLVMTLFSILMLPQSSLSAPIMFLCNKTDSSGTADAFLCQFDIQTNHRAREWKTTLNHFTFSINAITGIMLAMIIVIFVSTIFNIIRYRSVSKSHSSSSETLVPQRQSAVIEGNVKENADIGNNYETPVASGSGIHHIDESNDYLKLEPVEENLYDQLEHEKQLMKQGISTIAIDNAVYNEVNSQVAVDDNLYDAVEFKKTPVIDNAAYGNLDDPGDLVYDELDHS